MTNFTVEGPYQNRAADCTPILRALPDWFGIEEAIFKYSADIKDLPTLLAVRSVQTIGFISLKLHNPYCAEIYVMGVRPEDHRGGIGRALVAAAQEWLCSQGCEYMQVKTIGPSNADPFYARTRAFYQAVGFRPLEEFTQLWNEHNPCLILIKHL